MLATVPFAQQCFFAFVYLTWLIIWRNLRSHETQHTFGVIMPFNNICVPVFSLISSSSHKKSKRGACLLAFFQNLPFLCPLCLLWEHIPRQCFSAFVWQCSPSNLCWDPSGPFSGYSWNILGAHSSDILSKNLVVTVVLLFITFNKALCAPVD